MLILPAIDLKQGKCVRLYKGEMGTAKIFNDSPATQAKSFEDEGATHLHIVDLDGAFSGKSENGKAIKDILSATKLSCQLGGGIRTLDNVKYWFNLGVDRLILGTVAVKNPELVKEACKLYPNKIIVGVDAKNGMVATEGWAEASEMQVAQLAKKFEDCGVHSVIYTDISRDGTLSGFDVVGTQNLARAINIPVIASGGVASIDDLHKAKSLEKYGLGGVIMGKSLYEKKFTLRQAIEILR